MPVFWSLTMTWVVREVLPSICNFKISIWNFTCFSSRNLFYFPLWKKKSWIFYIWINHFIFCLNFFSPIFLPLIILLYFLGDFLNFTFQLCYQNFYLCNLVFKFSTFFLVLLIFLFTSSCSWFTDGISPFISLGILFIVLLFAGFSLFLVYFFGLFHGPFVPIVLSGSVLEAVFRWLLFLAITHSLEVRHLVIIL